MLRDQQAKRSIRQHSCIKIPFARCCDNLPMLSKPWLLAEQIAERRWLAAVHVFDLCEEQFSRRQGITQRIVCIVARQIVTLAQCVQA